MKKYEIKACNKFNGNSGTWNIEAENEQELRKEASDRGLVDIKSIRFIEDIKETDTPLDNDNQNTKPTEIPDAEAFLFEMDANNCDAITIMEGFGKTKTYTRKEIEKHLGL